jgi:hypothetical protein
MRTNLPGVRLNPRQDARCRSAIATTQLCKRLNYFALGLPEPQTGRPPEMSDAQIRAALGLLRKTLPDLAVTELRGDEDHPIAIEFTWAPALANTPVDTPADTPTIEADALEIEWDKAVDDDAC